MVATIESQFKTFWSPKKKLKVTSILKLKCMNNRIIYIKNKMLSFNNDDEVTRDCYVEDIEDIINRSESIIIDRETCQILTYIAGYVGRKASESIDCVSCKNSLVTATSDSNENINQKYLASLSRGGLKYPTQLSLQISTIAFQIFQIVISEPFDKYFLKLKNQKQYLCSIIREKLEGLLDSEYCTLHSSVLFSKFINTWCNILLNNYTKDLNDSFNTSASPSLRKLTIFSQ